jgi:hypothetical protein
MIITNVLIIIMSIIIMIIRINISIIIMTRLIINRVPYIPYTK